MHDDVLVKVPFLAPNINRPQAATGDAASLGQRLHGTLWASELAGAMTGATASKRFTTSKLARDLDKIEHIQRRGAAANGAKDLRHWHPMLHVGRGRKDTGSGCPEEKPERATPPPKPGNLLPSHAAIWLPVLPPGFTRPARLRLAPIGSGALAVTDSAAKGHRP